MDFSGKTVFVTGATRGIGKAIAEAFETAGARLVLTGTKATTIAAPAAAYPDRRYIAADFTIPESLSTCLDTIAGLPIDVCVNCAGANRIKPIHECSDADYDYIHTLNLKAPYAIIRTVSRGMAERGCGRIVNIASIWSDITKPGRSLYTTAKTGLIGMTRAVAVELAPRNILVNAVSPGFTRTELTAASLTPDEQRTLAGQVPLGRFGEPCEIADVVLFLASNRNRYITGQNIIVDGGFTIV